MTSVKIEKRWNEKQVLLYERPIPIECPLAQRVQTGEDLVLDQNWDTVNGFESNPDVRAVLLQNRPPGGVARVNGDPSKYTLTSRTTGTVLVAAKPGERLSLVGNPYILRFRRRQP